MFTHTVLVAACQQSPAILHSHRSTRCLRAPRCFTHSFFTLGLVGDIKSGLYALYQLPGQTYRPKTHCTTTHSCPSDFSNLCPLFPMLLRHSAPLYHITNTYSVIYWLSALDQPMDHAHRTITCCTMMPSLLTTFSDILPIVFNAACAPLPFDDTENICGITTCFCALRPSNFYAIPLDIDRAMARSISGLICTPGVRSQHLACTLIRFFSSPSRISLPFVCLVLVSSSCGCWGG